MKKVGYIAILVIAFGVGWRSYDYAHADPVPHIDTLYIDKPIPVEIAIPAKPTKPTRVTVYRDTTISVTNECVQVPTILVKNNFHLSAPGPITISGRKFVFTSFDPFGSEWVKREYTVPRTWWGAGIHAGVGQVFYSSFYPDRPLHPFIKAQLRVKRFKLSASIMPGEYAQTSLIYRIFGNE